MTKKKFDVPYANQMIFGWLQRHPGETYSAVALAYLFGVTPKHAKRVCVWLVGANMIVRDGDGFRHV